MACQKIIAKPNRVAGLGRKGLAEVGSISLKEAISEDENGKLTQRQSSLVSYAGRCIAAESIKLDEERNEKKSHARSVCVCRHEGRVNKNKEGAHINGIKTLREA